MINTAIASDPHYLAIRDFYGQRRAKRSGVRLIEHIDEGLVILELIGASLPAQQAYCLHPLLQADPELRASLQPDTLLSSSQLSAVPVALAMEYRAVANAYLSQDCRGPDDAIELSSLGEVNHMLIADKVQNRKDFERFHAETHERSATLKRYFQNWLRALGVSEDRYTELVATLKLR